MGKMEKKQVKRPRPCLREFCPCSFWKLLLIVGPKILFWSYKRNQNLLYGVVCYTTVFRVVTQCSDYVWCCTALTLLYSQISIGKQAPVVQKMHYNAINWINRYSLDSAFSFPTTYPLDGDLSVGYRYSTFEQLRGES